MRLYSKENITRPIAAMRRTGRFVHSYIITGEKGLGKRTTARYLAMSLLCDNHNACGECRQCRRVLKGQHPDFIEVTKEGRIYSVNDIRSKVVEDSFISPNDCDRKVYLLTDCDGWTDASQDALLKITEDPPDTAYFIFTASSKSVFLPTLISRSMVMEVSEADREGCIAAMTEHFSEKGTAVSQEKLSAAADAFGGNIGKCIDFAEGDESLAAAADKVRAIADAAAKGDAYSLAVLLHSLSGDRNEMRSALEMLMRVIRDAAVIKAEGGGCIGCAEKQSRIMAQRFSEAALLKMYDAAGEAAARCAGYCNAQAAAAVLAGKLGAV